MNSIERFFSYQPSNKRVHTSINVAGDDERAPTEQALHEAARVAKSGAAHGNGVHCLAKASQVSNVFRRIIMPYKRNQRDFVPLFGQPAQQVIRPDLRTGIWRERKDLS
jgi:hypothetical protein